MKSVILENDCLRLELSARFGAVLSLEYRRDGTYTHVLRPARPFVSDATQSAAFPLVPFGGRIADNSFEMDCVRHELQPNTDDPLRLHGDGWISEWTPHRVDPTRVVLSLHHAKNAEAPWQYFVQQRFSLLEDALEVTFLVENEGTETLPFGLGWHPYFPLTPQTRLTAPALAIWADGADFLPTVRNHIPPELDFSTPTPLPDIWINNVFEGWNRTAEINWPERHLSLRISATETMGSFVLFRPDQHFDDQYRGDWFCLEPMTHVVDAFHHSGRGGLVMLSPGETLAAGIKLTVVHSVGTPAGV